MQLTSTMKPFAVGDIFLGCNYLNSPDDDHMGDGRMLQFDKYWHPKGTLYTEGAHYFIVGCKVGPDGTLWAFDAHDHIAVQVSPEGKQVGAWDSGRSFGSINWDEDGIVAESIDVGFTAPHRSLAGLALYAGQGA